MRAHLENFIYCGIRTEEYEMIERVRSAVLLGIHQITVATGILLFPIALFAKRLGLAIPLHRILQEIESAYDQPK